MDTLINELKQIASECLQLPIDELTLEVKLSQLGIDSFSFVKLITVIEVTYNFEFDMKDLIVSKFLTFGNIVDYVYTRRR